MLTSCERYATLTLSKMIPCPAASAGKEGREADADLRKESQMGAFFVPRLSAGNRSAGGKEHDYGIF